MAVVKRLRRDGGEFECLAKQEAEAFKHAGDVLPKTIPNGFNCHIAYSNTIDWLLQLGSEYELSRTTIYNTMLTFARYLVLTFKEQEEVWHLTLSSDTGLKWRIILTAALFLSAKVCEVIPTTSFCTLKGIVQVWTDGEVTESQIKAAEIEILSLLEWRFVGPEIFTAPNILGTLLYMESNEDDVPTSSPNIPLYRRTMQLIDFCMLDPKSLQFLPSMICSSALCVLEGEKWVFRIYLAFGYTREKLKACMNWLYKKRVWLEMNSFQLPRDLPFDQQQHNESALELWNKLSKK